MGNPHVYPGSNPVGGPVHGGGRFYRNGDCKGGCQSVHVQEICLFYGNAVPAHAVRRGEGIFCRTHIGYGGMRPVILHLSAVKRQGTGG